MTMPAGASINASNTGVQVPAPGPQGPFYPGGLQGSPTTIAITSTPQLVTLPAGTQVSASAACTVNYTSATASTGPSVSGSFTWPGPMGGATLGGISLWVVTSATATLSYYPAPI